MKVYEAPNAELLDTQRETQTLSVIQILFSLKGRINRLTYWLYTLTTYFVFIALDFAGRELGFMEEILFLPVLVFFYTLFAIQVKRWHDRNKSGWWVLINFIPILNLWAIIANGFLRGDYALNDYGHPPS